MRPMSAAVAAEPLAVSRWPTVSVSASFMPDGAPTDAGTPSNLFASLDAHLSRDAWQGAYRRALAAWDSACALTVTWVDESAGQKGDIRFGGHALPAGELGFTYYPPAGECYLGTQAEYLPEDLTMLLSVLLHETGHALGLDHSSVPNAVMYPFLNIRSGLAPDDIARIRALYGAPPPAPPPLVLPDRYEPNNTVDTARGLGPLPSPYSLAGLTLHQVGDEDWFSFKVLNTGSYQVMASFDQIAGVGSSFFIAVFNNDRTRLARASTSSNTGSGAVTVTARLVAGQRYYLRLLSPSGGLFKYSVTMARAN